MHGTQAVNGNIRREQAVQLVRHKVRIQRGVAIEMRHH